MADRPKPLEVTGWLPNLLGPIDVLEDGAEVDIPRRQKFNLVGVTIEDEPDFDRTKLTFLGAVSEDCDEPAETHQVTHTWEDAACTEAPGAPLISVTSRRDDTISFNHAGGTFTPIWFFDPPSAAADTHDLYRLDVCLLLSSWQDAVIPPAFTSVTATCTFSVSDAGAVTFSVTPAETSDDAGLTTTTFSNVENVISLMIDVDGGDFVGVDVKGAVVYQLTKLSPIPTTGGGGGA